jgi:predicted DNA-binding protein (UPF0251 family)/predicted Fe-Mo cluster-binding NifX family protein
MPSGWTREQHAPAEVAIEDFEVLRLVDAHAYTIEEAAGKLSVSRSTAGRMLERARRAIALAMERRLPLYIDAAKSSALSSPEVGAAIASRRGGDLAIAVESSHPESAVARIFGRAPFFALPGGQGAIRYMENPGANVKRKAASLAVNQLAALGVGRVLAGRFGSEALESLGAASIEPLLVTGMKLRQAVELMSSSKK